MVSCHIIIYADMAVARLVGVLRPDHRIPDFVSGIRGNFLTSTVTLNGMVVI